MCELNMAWLVALQFLHMVCKRNEWFNKGGMSLSSHEVNIVGLNSSLAGSL